MANKDKALREGGLAAICRHLVEYFKKTDTAGAMLIQLAEATEQGFSDAETGIAAAAETAQAEHVTFSDGQTLQQKFSGNALGGVTSVNGVTGDVTIGGRNLALDTAEEKVSTAKDAATMGVHWELSDYGKSVLNTVGTPVVLSYEAKADVEGQRVSVNLRVGTSSAAKHVTPYNQFVYPTTEYKRYTFSCQTLLEDPGRAWVLLGAAPDGQVGNVYVRNLYVGTGSAVQDWTPAPEDTQNAIDALDEKKAEKPVVHAATIGASGWVDTTDAAFKNAGYLKMYSLAVSGATAADGAECRFSPASLKAANDCGVCPTVNVIAGYIRFYAASAPVSSLALEYQIIKG